MILAAMTVMSTTETTSQLGIGGFVSNIFRYSRSGPFRHFGIFPFLMENKYGFIRENQLMLLYVETRAPALGLLTTTNTNASDSNVISVSFFLFFFSFLLIHLEV